MPATINADNGVVSGSAGVKTTADTSGELALQSNGVTQMTVASTGVSLATGGAVVGASATQTLTNKMISGANNTLTVDGTNAVGFRAIPSAGAAKTGSYTLATSDVGEFVEVASGGSITIPNAVFAVGDVVSIFNNTSGNVTITCTIATAYKAGTDADQATVTLQTRGVCTVLFISGTVCVISGNLA